MSVGPLWERVEIFEALHHTTTIDSPMTSADLDVVVDMLSPTSGEEVLDLACGHGELLRRLRNRAAIRCTGVDLSPWMLQSAQRLSTEQNIDGLRWVLDDANRAAATYADRTNITTCLGGSWIWHGFDGTLRTLAQLTAPGGRIAIGDMHLRDHLDPEVISKTHGAVESVAELEASFDAHGLELVGRVNTSDRDWDEYLAGTRRAARAWAELHPGERADSFIAEQQQWELDHARDQEILTWSVWVAERRV